MLMGKVQKLLSLLSSQYCALHRAYDNRIRAFQRVIFNHSILFAFPFFFHFLSPLGSKSDRSKPLIFSPYSQKKKVFSPCLFRRHLNASKHKMSGKLLDFE